MNVVIKSIGFEDRVIVIDAEVDGLPYRNVFDKDAVESRMRVLGLGTADEALDALMRDLYAHVSEGVTTPASDDEARARLLGDGDLAAVQVTRDVDCTPVLSACASTTTAPIGGTDGQ